MVRGPTPTSTLEELVTFFQNKKKHKVAKHSRKPKMHSLVHCRRRLPIEFQRQLIMLFYGSSKHFNEPNMKIGELGRIFTIHPNTIRTILRRFKEQGRDIANFCDRSKLKSQHRQLKGRVSRFVLDPQVLERWAGKSLRERALLLQTRFRVPISHGLLRSFYIKHNISYRKTQMVYRAALIKQDTHLEARQQYALVLGNVIRHRLPLLFLDESSFHSFSYQNRTWSYRDKTLNVPINKTRYSVTVFATIGNCIENSYCSSIESSTNAESFLAHLQQVKAALRDKNCKPYLVLDNAAAHKSAICRDYLDTHFTALWMPAYTPQFNSQVMPNSDCIHRIEFLWGLAKIRFKQYLLQKPLRDFNKAEFETMVHKAVASVGQASATNLMRANFEYIRSNLIRNE